MPPIFPPISIIPSPRVTIFMSPVPHRAVLETGDGELARVVGIFGGLYLVDVDAVAGGLAAVEIALLEMIIVREDGVRLLGVSHIFLNAEVRDPAIEMQRRPHGHGRQIGRAMAASAHLIKGREVGNAA